MAVMKIHTIPGMSRREYEEIHHRVKSSQLAAEGFVSHHAAFDDHGLHVVEIWDSRQHHDDWFASNIVGAVRDAVGPPAFAELHEVVTTREPTDPV